MPNHRVLAIALGVALLASSTPVRAANLGNPSLQKAAVKCQRAIVKAGEKFLAAQLKRLDTCSTGLLGCVQTKPGVDSCRTKAQTICRKSIAAMPAAQDALVAKISKACGAPLAQADLLASDGMGFGRLAGACNRDFQLDVCGDVSAFARCLVAQHERTSELLLPLEQPRAGELIADALVSPVPPFDLTVYPGCGTCSEAPPDEIGKAVARCGAAMTKVGRSFAGAVAATLENCVTGIFACTQSKANDPTCLSKARASCEAGRAKLVERRAKLAADIDKRCGEKVLPFATLSADRALNLEAPSGDCVELGFDRPESLGDYIDCLRQQHECVVADLVRAAVPRSEEFVTDEHTGATGPLLVNEACNVPTPLSTPGATIPSSTITRFIKTVTKRVPGGPGILATQPTSPAPDSSADAPRTITIVNGTPRFRPGVSQVVKLGYRLGNTLPDTPTLIVTIRRDDLVLSDHFELPLEVDKDEIELEIEYPPEVPTCAFAIAFATSDAGRVSDYTRIEQVFDPATPTPTPTPKPTPGAQIFFESFENGALDSRLSVGATGSFESEPGIKPAMQLGSVHAFGFGRSTCEGGCFDNFATTLRIAFQAPTFVTVVSFKEMEVLDNWGSDGSVHVDGQPLGSGSRDFGRLPFNDRQADMTFRRRTFSINRVVSEITLRVGDITKLSEIYLDDLEVRE